MPIASPPSRGFQEFQRTSPYDSGGMYSDTNLLVGAGIDSGVLDVSRYAYIGGFDTATTGNIRALFTWYGDTAASLEIAQRSFQLTFNVLGFAQYRLPNLGPFVRAQWTGISGGVVRHSSALIGTNRQHPCELIPQNPVPIDQDTTAIGSSATATVYPSDYYAGPMMVWSTIGSGGTVIFQYLTSANTWSTVSQWPVAALTNDTRTVVAPPGAWRFQVLNGAASPQTYNLKVTPSLTGSS